MPRSFKPTAAMAAAARRALEVRAEKPPSQRGMTRVGLNMARKISAREALSIAEVRRMGRFLTRMESSVKDGSTWGDKGKGWQAWNGWGGDPARTWARRVIARYEREHND